MSKVIEFDKDNPLDPVAGENRNQNRAFIDYALMGTTRSIRKLHDEYSKPLAEGRQKPPTLSVATLWKWSITNGWVERAKAFDVIERSSRLVEAEAAREMWKEKRLQLAQALFNKAAIALQNVKVGTQGRPLKLSEATAAVGGALKELRIEMGDQKDIEQVGEVVIRVIREDLQPAPVEQSGDVPQPGDTI